MTNPLAWAIVTVWALTALGATAFVVALGPPWQHEEKTAAWHMSATSAAAALENYGLVLAALVLHHLPLLPTLLIYTTSMAIIYWRLWWLVRSRRAKRKERNG